MDQGQGWIKLYRKILDSPIWNDPYYLKLWMYCLLKAAHKKREVIIGNQMITLLPGQFITGRKSLASDLNEGMKPKQKLNDLTWWRYLNNLEEWQMLNIKKTNKYSIVSIVKWNDYQESEHQMNNKCTSDEHQMNTNKNVKNERIKEYITTTTENPIQLFEKLLCRLSPVQMESLLQWQDDFGDPDIINEAIRIADNRNKRTFGFVEYLLKEWKNNNLDSLDRVRAYEQEKFNKIKSKSYRPKPITKSVRREVVPDWFEDRQQLKSEDDEIVNFEEEKKKMEERLKKYKTGG